MSKKSVIKKIESTIVSLPQDHQKLVEKILSKTLNFGKNDLDCLQIFVKFLTKTQSKAVKEKMANVVQAITGL